MNPISNILEKFPLLILDGAMATELENRGCQIQDSLWSAKILAENPQMIRNVHYDYFKAGADCAITASYQATINGFVEKGYSEEEAISLIQRSVQLAKDARDEFWANPDNRVGRPTPLVAGSVGPYGAYLADGSEYRGHYGLTMEELMEFHRPRIQLLVDAGADILACETFPCLIEAKAITALLKEFPGVYCWISFSAKNEHEISDGTAIAECAQYLNDFEQVAAVGVNCTAPQYIESLIQDIKANTNKPVIVYPNSGEEYHAEDKTWHGHADQESYGCCAKNWHAVGANIIGGCCRTTPADIAAISDWARI